MAEIRPIDTDILAMLALMDDIRRLQQELREKTERLRLAIARFESPT